MAPAVQAGPNVEECKAIIADLCSTFYSQGWVSGTGGGISVKAEDGRIVMAPSGVQKERMQASDMFVLTPTGDVAHTPEARRPPQKPPKLSECSPLFMAAYELRNAGAVLHSHATECVLATLLDPTATEFRCTNLEMIKGIAGHGYYDTLVVPVIENTARECELTDRLRETMAKYPMTKAILVRRHGVYVWGDNWIQAKTHAECYHYLFKAAVDMRAIGIDASVDPAAKSNGGPISQKRPRVDSALARANGSHRVRAVVLDIEGTVTTIDFVKNTLFPYALNNCGHFLRDTWDDPKTQRYVKKVLGQAVDDVADGLFEGSVVAPPMAPRRQAIEAVKANVRLWMLASRKVPALKELQGAIWKGGYASGALPKCPLFADVAPAIRAFVDAGIKVFSYSSGSRFAQKLLYQNTTDGDISHLISGYFDPASCGRKTEKQSYEEIALSLGFSECPGDVAFFTDLKDEVTAATDAGLLCVHMDRPGNAIVPEGALPSSVKTITSFEQFVI